ncbi:MAG: hypothetical protein LBE09_00595 [Christensenellaceae bacterium]|jgi:hypothetical protein|nr:hypothetical protein [Christensenellaceae bacterium]
MRKSISFIHLILIVILVVSVAILTVCSSVVASEETRVDTYYGDISSRVIEISSAHQLLNLKNKEAHTIFRLTGDINLETDLSWHSRVLDWESKGWRPLDTEQFSSCVFDGGGFSILNLRIDRDAECVGFFSRNLMNVRNLFFVNASINGDKKAGALAGINYGLVENVHVTGSIQGQYYAGGLFAVNYGNVDNCSFDGTVSGEIAGGLIAENFCTRLSNSYSKGQVKGYFAGGLIGIADRLSYDNSNILFSFSMSHVTEDGEDLGLIAGFLAIRYDRVNIEDCYSLNGNVTVSSGKSDGIKALSIDEFLSEVNLSGFDFENYWAYSNSGLVQRTLAISSYDIITNYLVKVVGDRKYYLPGESTTLIIDNTETPYLKLSYGSINGKKINNSFENGEYQYGVITDQINIDFRSGYMTKVVLNVMMDEKMSEFNKTYYAEDEVILILLPRRAGYVTRCYGKYLYTDRVFFTEVSTGEYDESRYVAFSTPAPSRNYADVLYISVDFVREGVTGEFTANAFGYIVIVFLGGGIVIYFLSRIISEINKKICKRWSAKVKVRALSQIKLRARDLNRTKNVIGVDKKHFDWDFKRLIFIIVAFILMIITILVMHTKIFEKWESITFHASEMESDLKYFVDGEEYTYYQKTADSVSISYLLSDPEYVIRDRSSIITGMIIAGIFAIFFLLRGIILEFRRKRKDEKDAFLSSD